MDRVLCHGDLWSTNILWKQSGDKLCLAALVDYQIAHFGCSATDLVRLFSSCLSGRDRREHWEELLDDYYEYLKEETGGIEVSYNLDQLKEAYRQIFPIGAYVILQAIEPLYNIHSKTLEKGHKESLETAMEKIECLLDDIIHYHERNMESKNSSSQTSHENL
ncbi:hypothetical protein COOONC_09774 [Cooperia oncophora]